MRKEKTPKKAELTRFTKEVMRWVDFCSIVAILAGLFAGIAIGRLLR